MGLDGLSEAESFGVKTVFDFPVIFQNLFTNKLSAVNPFKNAQNSNYLNFPPFLNICLPTNNQLLTRSKSARNIAFEFPAIFQHLFTNRLSAIKPVQKVCEMQNAERNLEIVNLV